MQVFPRVDPRVVPIIEGQPHGIIADRLDPDDRDGALARNDLLLARSVTLHFGARALDPQILRRQRKPRSVVERDVQYTLRLVQPDLGRGHHHSASLRASSGSMIGIPSRTG